MHHIIARITFRPDAADEGRTKLTELAAASRTEPGNVSYDVYQVDGQKAVFFTVEQWKDKAAAAAHMQMPHLLAALTAVRDMLADKPEILDVLPCA